MLSKQAMCSVWRSATSFCNFYRDDPLLDYLDRVGATSLADLESKRIPRWRLRDYTKPQGPTDPSFVGRATSGLDYEAEVMEDLKAKFPKHAVVGVTTREDAQLTRNYTITRKLIRGGEVDLILHGLVRHYATQTFGVPDLIMKGAALRTLGVIPPDDATYYAVDIKGSSLPVSDAWSVATTNATAGYKAQVLIYALALKEMAEDRSTDLVGYLLGKSLRNQDEVTPGGERLGVVDFNTPQNETFLQRLPAAIRWHNRLETDGHRMELFPPSHKELYPNMKNKYCGHYSTVKADYARAIDEITCLWMCTPAHRRAALAKGKRAVADLTSTEDLDMNPDSLAASVLGRILALNASKNLMDIPLANNYGKWRTVPRDEWVLDIETCDSLLYMLTFSTDAATTTLIAPTLDLAGEASLLSQFSAIVSAAPPDRIVHWGAIDPSFILSRMRHHSTPGRDALEKEDLWCDLHRVFCYPRAPIVVKGMTSFSLKEVSARMAGHGLVPERFKGEVRSGTQSVDVARRYYKEKDRTLMRDLIRYNIEDVRAVQDILRFIRM